jgi:hypothetical protein
MLYIISSSVLHSYIDDQGEVTTYKMDEQDVEAEVYDEQLIISACVGPMGNLLQEKVRGCVALRYDLLL